MPKTIALSGFIQKQSRRIIRLLISQKYTRQRPDTRACSVCGLAPLIRINQGDLGRFCLYYGVRIPPNELDASNRGIRVYCVRDGNHFVWPLVGIKPKELLEWRVQHIDRHLQRKALIWGIVIAVISLFMTAIGVWAGR